MDFMDFRYVSGNERENLYKEVLTEPMTTVAKRYNMSDSVLRKNCRRLGIPLATSGYWSKIKAGKKIAKDPLPDVY
ncbi:RWP-RK domain-containing protein [Clostridium estertheticum]|uniref:RWP-RK domain-containing protein n=1 Tax=Clostridium estertheticum TaxID=238834 RepID=A0AA47EKK4_9CLOT|nr:RWP-RK domain-containing protein [Clostridium estertheticum]MBU3154623.1 RWP-RK domain-containing protein [Clostridium estertheticum]MBU3198770.1 RWP-RK domain-containing protein [Clostridium estertheticum]WAG61800.1 RWP-RK domain-containing protein [Clostridium estertheticum]WAG64079.1 RWP-RK domain-containing protein [Clostridium estertheticum]